jgi:UDP-2,3-diacylglucosamine hydrolase
VTPTDPAPLGLIAGCGELPLEIARSARRRARPVVAVALQGQTDPALESEVSQLHWLYPGEVARITGVLRAAGVAEAVLAGKLPKLTLDDPAALHPDAAALSLLRRLPDRHDASILSGVADHLAAHGIRLLPQSLLVPELVATPGPYGRVLANREQLADLAFGWPLAKAVAALGIGQTLVVRGRAVLAVEAIEGTDAAILRAGRIAPGACVVKLAGPRQDPRFDLPAIGEATLSALIEAKAAVLAFQAGATLVLQREALVAAADAHGIALLGVGEPPPWDAP